MILTEKQQLEIFEKYKKSLICPKCNANLVNRDYKINKKTLLYFLIIFIMGVFLGIFWMWSLLW